MSVTALRNVGCWKRRRSFDFNFFVLLVDGRVGKAFMFTANSKEVHLVFRVDWAIK